MFHDRLSPRLLLSLPLALLLLTSLAQAAIQPGANAPEITGRELVSGNSLSLSDLRGKWVFVDFWASWCKPCMKELPNIVGLHRELATSAGSNFTVLGVSLDSEGTLGALRKAVKKNGVTYPVVYCTDGCNDVARDWGVQSIPSTFLIDPQGRVAAAEIPIRQVRALIEQGGPEPSLARLNESRTAQRDGGTVPARQPSALGANYGVRPTQVKCTERLMPSQAGMPGAHDLEVTMAIQPNGPRVSNYRLFLRATKRGRDGRQAEANWRYDINLLLDPRNRNTPYFIEINDSSDPAKALGYAAPDLTALIDIERGICQFIVPLASDTLKLNYAMALYEDPALAAR